MPRCIGIDFGTTKSVVSWVNPNTRRAEPIRLGRSGATDIVPTSVFKDGNRLLFGDDAESEMLLAPSRYRRDFKLSLGDNTPLIQGTIKGHVLDAEALTCFFLRYLREECSIPGFVAEDDTPVEKAVIAYPVRFALSPAKLTALERAAQHAGFKEVEIMCEPEAAGMAFLVERKTIGEEPVLVVDWGGGTLDVSMISIDGKKRIKCLKKYFAGNDEMGGERIDRLFLEHIRKRYEEEKGLHIETKVSALPSQLREVKRAKERLDRQDAITVNLASGLERIKVSRRDLESIVQPFVKKAIEIINKVLNKAKVDYQPSKMLLVGGTNKMPYIQKELQNSLQLETIIWQNARIAVALGAAYAATDSMPTKWIAGIIHPEHPHVIAGDVDGEWKAEDGYVFVDPELKVEDDGWGEVEWSPGEEHSVWSHVIAGDEEGKWMPEPGYVWVANERKVNAGDWRVKWKSGTEHTIWPHVIADDEEGNWKAEDGYVFANPDLMMWDDGWGDVEWSPGEEHSAWPHVIAGDEEGNWMPEPGYVWVANERKVDAGDWRVKWKPGEEHPEWPHVIADEKEGAWSTENGYKWANPDLDIGDDGWGEVEWDSNYDVDDDYDDDDDDGESDNDDDEEYMPHSIKLSDVVGVFKGCQSERFYVGYAIPWKMRQNAKNRMQITEEILALYDTADYWGHGDEGWVIVPTGIYARSYIPFSNPVFYEWEEIGEIKLDGKTLWINSCETFIRDEDVKLAGALKKLVSIATK